MDRDGGNTRQRIYRCGSNYTLSKLIMDNWYENLSEMENPHFSEFVHCARFSTRSRIGRVYTHIKIASNTKINHIMVSSTDLYNDISIDRLPSKSKIRNDSCYFNNSL